MQSYLLKTDVWTYETCKLVWGNLAKSLESGNLRLRTECLYSLKAFFIAVTITSDIVLLLLASFLELCVLCSNHLLVLYLRAFVTNTEERCLQYIHMSFLDKVREELKEESDDEQTDVHTIHIGISSHYHLIISKSVKTVLYVEGSLKEIELLILINHFLGQTIAVEWFSTK